MIDISNIINELTLEMKQKIKDVRQLGSEYVKLKREITNLSSTAIFGNIILKDKKYYVFVSKMVKGKRVRKQLGSDDKLKFEYEQRLAKGLRLTIANERLALIEEELFDFHRRIINAYF